MDNIVGQLRRKMKIRQGDLAKILKVSRQTISAIENNHYSPTLGLAFKISDFFGLPLEEIFNFKNSSDVETDN